MSVILVEDEIVHFEVLGRGKPVIFLHSWVGSWRYWIPTMQAASIGYRAYALDLWGYGDSAKCGRYQINDQVQLVSQFMEMMGISRTALIGHGLGAELAVQFALDFPDYVDRMMTLAYPVGENSINQTWFENFQPGLIEDLLDKDAMDATIKSENQKADPLAIKKSGEHNQNNHRILDWANIKIPWLMVSAQNDGLVEAPQNDQLAGLPENIHAILFEDCGHFIMLEESSKFQRLMTEFLSLPSGKSPSELKLKEEWKRRMR